VATRLISNYALCGDQAWPNWTSWFDFERIPTRSRPCNWNMRPHKHEAFIQVLYLTKGNVEAPVGAAWWVMVAHRQLRALVQEIGQMAVAPYFLKALCVQTACLSNNKGLATSTLRTYKALRLEKFRAPIDENYEKRRPITAYARHLGITPGAAAAFVPGGAADLEAP
jgi:hypothetical protein